MKNIVLRLIALILTGSASLWAPSAGAAQMIYSATGIFDGYFNNMAFSGKLVQFVGTGDDAYTMDTFDERTTPLASLRFMLGGKSYDVDGKALVFVSYVNGFAGFVGVGEAGTFGILRFDFKPASSEIPAPAVFFTNGLTAPAASTGGPLLLTAGSRLTFINGLAMSAVPEPSTWLLLIFGFGVTGIVLQRQRVGEPSRGWSAVCEMLPENHAIGKLASDGDE